MSDQRTDEARWRDAGKRQTMTLEQRAEYIAAARSPRSITGGTIWTKLRDRALEQLREVDALARHDGGTAAMPRPNITDSTRPAKIRAGIIASEDGELGATATEVIIEDAVVPTGLLDANGTPLYRIRRPIGFDLSGTQR